MQCLGERCFDFLNADRTFRRFDVALTTTLFVVGKAGSRRNKTTHNHVLLEAAQAVALAGYRSFGQYAGSLLEGGRGDEALGGQRGLGDTQKFAIAGSGLAYHEERKRSRDADTEMVVSAQEIEAALTEALQADS